MFEHIGVDRGGQRGHDPPKFFEHIVILCFERRFSKQNSVFRLKSNILPPPIFGLATPLFEQTLKFDMHEQKPQGSWNEGVAYRNRKPECNYFSSNNIYYSKNSIDWGATNCWFGTRMRSKVWGWLKMRWCQHLLSFTFIHSQHLLSFTYVGFCNYKYIAYWAYIPRHRQTF